MGRAQKPYAGFVTSLKLLRADSSSATDDAGTAFQSYMDTKPYEMGGDRNVFDCDNAILWAKVSTSTMVQLTYTRDYGAQTITDIVSLTAREAGQTRTWRKFEKSSVGRAFALQVRLGDASAQSVSWTFDKLVIPYRVGDALT